MANYEVLIKQLEEPKEDVFVSVLSFSVEFSSCLIHKDSGEEVLVFHVNGNPSNSIPIVVSTGQIIDNDELISAEAIKIIHSPTLKEFSAKEFLDFVRSPA